MNPHYHIYLQIGRYWLGRARGERMPFFIARDNSDGSFNIIKLFGKASE